MQEKHLIVKTFPGHDQQICKPFQFSQSPAWPVCFGAPAAGLYQRCPWPSAASS